MKSLSVAGGLLGLLAGVSLLGSSTAFAAGPRQQFPVPNVGQVTNIYFDGHCDGLAIHRGSAGLPGAEATRIGTTPDCIPPDSLYGIFVSLTKAGVSLADAASSLYVVIGGDHSWVYYGDSGGGNEEIINSGTWSFVPKPGDAATRPSTAGVLGSRVSHFGGTVLPRVPRPALTFNLSFDGFCDGEALNLPGAAGFPGIDGVQTGCASDPLIGSGSNVTGSAGMWDYTTNVFWFIGLNHDFIVYGQNEDGTEYIINTGTWSPGMPAAPQGRTVLPSDSH